MAHSFKTVSEQKRKLDLMLAGGLSLLALIVYASTMARGVYPGESASLMTNYSGLNPLPLPMHPIWGALVAKVSALKLFTLPLRLNCLSVLFGVLCVPLIYRLTSFLINELIHEEYSIEHAERVSSLAGTLTTLAFLFAAPIWQAATRLQHQTFAIFLVLVVANLLTTYAQTRRFYLLLILGLIYGLGIVETPAFLPLIPLFLLFVIGTLWRNEQFRVSRVGLIGLMAALSLSLYYFAARHFMATQPFINADLNSAWSVVVAVWKNQANELLAGLPRTNWLILLLMGLLPWLTAGFAAPRALNNERAFSQYILHLVLTILVIAGLSNAPFSPWALVKQSGHLPIWSYTMLAMLAGYLLAYWYLLFKVARPRRDIKISNITKRTGDWLGLIMTYPLFILVVLLSLLNVLELRRNKGDFADYCAHKILTQLGSRTWFVTDGTLDPHLAVWAHERKQELNLLCLQNDLNPVYLKRLGALVEEKQLFSAADLPRMKNSLSLGLVPFLQDWFASDTTIEHKVAIFSIPDLWFTANLEPVSEFFFFSGCRDKTQLQGTELYQSHQAFWQEMEPILKAPAEHEKSPTPRLRGSLRRHLGFVANNLGVLLEDLELNQEAFDAYTYVHDVIDPHNISTMFNRFEMARRGVSAADASKEAIERELREFINNLKHRYPLWSLSRYYGYVRTPELFYRLGWNWALSGQTGAALHGLRTATSLIPGQQGQAATLLSQAAIYKLSGELEKTADAYHTLLKQDSQNRAAMLGLARLALQKGEAAEARNWLDRAAQTDLQGGTLGVEWAMLYLINNDIDNARLVLHETTDLQPKNLSAWAMLAMIQLQQNELEELETVTLSKMENIAGTADNYFIQVSRGQLLIKKGDNFKQQAREAFIRASLLRPDVTELRDTILQLDIELNDHKSAERHAHLILRSDRQHALANYVMGSLRLRAGAHQEAQLFLRQSVATRPTVAALNDLAEALRRVKDYNEAEKFARQACQNNPEQYVVWETLAAILLEANKNLAEAESSIKQAQKLNQNDLRVSITLARIQLKQGHLEDARATIHKVRNSAQDLSAYDQKQLAQLMEEARIK